METKKFKPASGYLVLKLNDINQSLFEGQIITSYSDGLSLDEVRRGVIKEYTKNYVPGSPFVILSPAEGFYLEEAPPLQIGDKVSYENKWVGTIISKSINNPKLFIVEWNSDPDFPSASSMDPSKLQKVGKQKMNGSI
jgi:hypothetical protein